MMWNESFQNNAEGRLENKRKRKKKIWKGLHRRLIATLHGAKP